MAFTKAPLELETVKLNDKLINFSMRILVVSKRQYMSRDLLNDLYGRFREIPLALAIQGHQVEGICLSYRPRNEGLYYDKELNVQVIWHAMNIKRLFFGGATNYWHTLDRVGRCFLPDVVLACSDAVHAILGVRIARRLGVALVTDLYDNFESYPITRFPGMRSIFRRSLCLADGIACVSRPLANYVREKCEYQGPMAIIENAVPKGLFHPLDRVTSRCELGLPKDGFFIGTAGSISRSRGIETLFKAFDILAMEQPNIYLVLAGPCDKKIPITKNSHVLYLGILPPKRIPIFLSALDIAIICNRESEFGKYCFPQKFYEAVACGVPVLAADTGVMREVLDSTPEYLFEPENVDSLVTALRRQLRKPASLKLDIPTWNTQGLKLEGFLKKCVKISTR